MAKIRSSTDVALDRHLSPVNKTAARVVSNGEHWNPMKKIQTRDSKLPIPFTSIKPMAPIQAGFRCGALVVLGRANGASTSNGSPYVCRCLCGYYTIRRSKAIRNEANDMDACEICRHKQYLARKSKRLAFGHNFVRGEGA